MLRIEEDNKLGFDLLVNVVVQKNNILYNVRYFFSHHHLNISIIIILFMGLLNFLRKLNRSESEAKILILGL